MEYNLYEELKGKYIKIKSLREIKKNALYIINSSHIKVSESNWFTKEMGYLCGKVLYVDEKLCPKYLLKDLKKCLIKERELIYYDEDTKRHFYLDKTVFDVIEVIEDKDKEITMEKEIDYLEKEYGIKEDTVYKLVFKECKQGEEKTVTGVILNFCPSTNIVMKTDVGLIIIDYKNIVRLYPIKIN